MKKAERQQRNKEIARVGFAYLKMEIGLVKALWDMEGMYGLSRSQLRNIIMDAQKACRHKFIHPYELQPEYTVCETCWKQA